MAGYLLRRLVAGIVVVWVVATVVFGLMHLRPGDPGLALLPQGTPMWKVRDFDVVNGFDKPLYVQYGYFIKNLVLHGRLATMHHVNPHMLYQLGPSAGFTMGVRLQDIVTGPLLNSLYLTVGCYLLTIPLSLLLARIGVRRRGYGALLGTTSRVGYAIPPFILAFVMYQLFTFTFPILPGNPLGWAVGDVTSQPSALVLPIVTLALGQIAFFAMLMRGQLQEHLGAAHIYTAAAGGLSPSRILNRHVLRNAAIPVVHAVPARIAGLLGAQAIVELVFNYPGIGPAFIVAAGTHHHLFALGAILLVSAVVVVGSLLADVVTAVLDPRVRTALR